MSYLKLLGIGKSFGEIVAVRDVDLGIAEGELVSFLGPSGCGKTTLLRIIAGLERPTSGRIQLGGECITDRPAHERGIGMVFQSLALFPHLTVAENVAYGLRLRGADRAACRAKAQALLELVRLPGAADRDVSELSGGQRQRVAIARALALEPKVFLLDEPLSSLDAKLREEMQIELKQLQQRLKVTTILVTHDQREAMTMSDRVVVMSTARVQQTGAPLQIYREPANAFVADFMGAGNRLPVERVDGHTVAFEGTAVGVGHMTRARPSRNDVLVIRPEDVVLDSAPDAENTLIATVSFVRDLGSSVEFHLRAKGRTLIATTTPKERPEFATGDTVSVSLPRDACRVIPE